MLNSYTETKNKLSNTLMEIKRIAASKFSKGEEKVSGTFYCVSRELEYIRVLILKSRPYGDDNWMNKVVKKFGLEMTLRQRGRPQKGS